MTTGPVDLFVDVEELRRVHQELAALLAELEGIGGGVAASPATLGSRDVAEAVDRFAVRWDEGRRQIAENLAGCLRYAATAADEYTATEQALRSAVAPTTNEGNSTL